MVGSTLVAHCQTHGDEVSAHEHVGLDITNADDVHETFARVRPDTVINCAAWTDVDGCELDPERALAVNAVAVESMAYASRQVGASFVTISTDYVFAGDKEGYYTQRDDPEPRSAYGISKLKGEWLARVAAARTIVVRTGWIFGHGGRNFLATALARARRGEQLKAPRPRNSRLRCLLSPVIGLAPLPDWQSALREFAAQTQRMKDVG
jgi:dTDP-4-dehydrorhamnose reductase